MEVVGGGGGLKFHTMFQTGVNRTQFSILLFQPCSEKLGTQ